jgi:hypothetical protein
VARRPADGWQEQEQEQEPQERFIFEQAVKLAKEWQEGEESNVKV